MAPIAITIDPYAFGISLGARASDPHNSGGYGAFLLARLLGLSDAQESILNIAFRLSDEQGLPLLDLKDLQALLLWIGENRQVLPLCYGSVSSATVGAIQRRLLVL